MSSHSLCRKALLLLLCAGLSGPWATAATQKPKAATAVAPARFDPLGSAWSFFTSLWSEEGCRIDPDGRCLTGATQAPPTRPNLDTGCRIDPNGSCHS